MKLTVAEYARRVGKSRHTIYWQIKKKKLKSGKVLGKIFVEWTERKSETDS